MLSFYVFIATFAALIHINNELATMLILKYLNTLGRYILLMGRSFARPERMRMFLKQYIKEMSALGVDSIGIVLLISFFIGAVICIQMKLNIQSPWMPRWGLHHTRDFAFGVLLKYHVSYPRWQGGLEHCVGVRHNARDATD